MLAALIAAVAPQQNPRFFLALRAIGVEWPPGDPVARLQPFASEHQKKLLAVKAHGGKLRLLLHAFGLGTGLALALAQGLPAPTPLARALRCMKGLAPDVTRLAPKKATLSQLLFHTLPWNAQRHNWEGLRDDQLRTWGAEAQVPIYIVMFQESLLGKQILFQCHRAGLGVGGHVIKP